MLIGRSVFIYNTGEGFEKPTPGIITAVQEENDRLVSVEAFFPKNHQQVHSTPLELVYFVPEEDGYAGVQKGFNKGHKRVCIPYNPAEPEGVSPPKEKPVKETVIGKPN